MAMEWMNETYFDTMLQTWHVFLHNFLICTVSSFYLNRLSGRTDQFMLYRSHGASYLYISFRFGGAPWTAIVKALCRGSVTFTLNYTGSKLPSGSHFFLLGDYQYDSSSRLETTHRKWYKEISTVKPTWRTFYSIY
jgi:hypothetical protein